jgi:hypothetical protein
MRWVLPLIVAAALAICAADHSRASARRRRRTVLDGPAWLGSELPLAPGGDDPVTEDRRPAARQAATFDAATGTLSWADDERYN